MDDATPDGSTVSLASVPGIRLIVNPSNLGYLRSCNTAARVAKGEFLLLLNTGPLNAALVNSVSAKIRATAVAVNLFVIHALGDVPSPIMIGWVSDRTNLQVGFYSTVVAVVLSATILFYGMRFAPKLPVTPNNGLRADGEPA